MNPGKWLLARSSDGNFKWTSFKLKCFGKDESPWWICFENMSIGYIASFQKYLLKCAVNVLGSQDKWVVFNNLFLKFF